MSSVLQGFGLKVLRILVVHPDCFICESFNDPQSVKVFDSQQVKL